MAAKARTSAKGSADTKGTAAKKKPAAKAASGTGKKTASGSGAGKKTAAPAKSAAGKKAASGKAAPAVRKRTAVVRNPEAMEQIRQAVGRLSTEGLNSVEQTGWLHVLLGTVLGQLDFQQREEHREQDLPSRLLLYIGEHFREEISAESIAQAFGYSGDHLAKSFRSCFRMGIARYINTLRLKNAVVLMRENKRSITDCALESGFGSLRTFYRVFAEEFGCSPREYLRRE